MTRFWWLKAIGGPGSLHFFAVVGGAGLILVVASKRTRRAGRRILLGLCALYFVLSLPVVATFIGRSAPPFDLKDVPALGQADDIFVFDGDNHEARAALAAAIDRSTHAKTVWILGFGSLTEALQANGLGEDRVRVGYSDGNSTDGQVSQMQKLMKRYKIPRAVVIVSRVQAERVTGLVRRQALDAVVIASPVDREPATSGLWQFVPSYAGLMLSRDGLYERAAVMYYRWKGWI